MKKKRKRAERMSRAERDLVNLIVATWRERKLQIRAARVFEVVCPKRLWPKNVEQSIQQLKELTYDKRKKEFYACREWAVSRRTVQRWVRAFRRNGTNGLQVQK